MRASLPATSTGSCPTRRISESLTLRRRNWAFRRKRWWSPSISMPIRRPPRFRWPSTRRSGTAESSAATWLCWKRWAVDLHGVQQRSGIEIFGISGDKSNCRQAEFPLRKRNRGGVGARRLSGEKNMADLGIARVTNEPDAANTLTRADLADVVHRRLGLSRAESAGVVERVLHHMCHALAKGQNVKTSGFGPYILRDKGQRIGRNPKTGIEVPIAPRRVMTFRASQIMRDRIAKG